MDDIEMKVDRVRKLEEKLDEVIDRVPIGQDKVRLESFDVNGKDRAGSGLQMKSMSHNRLVFNTSRLSRDDDHYEDFKYNFDKIAVIEEKVNSFEEKLEKVLSI